MGDVTHPTRRSSPAAGRGRLRTVAGVGGGLVGALAVAASALAYTILGASEDAPFLSAGAQPARRPAPEATAATTAAALAPAEQALPPLAASQPEAATTAAPTTAEATPTVEVAAAPPAAVAAATTAPAAPAPTSAPALVATPASTTPATSPNIVLGAAAPPPAPVATAAPAPAAAVALSAREQGLLEAMNARRASAGLSPLAVSAALTGVARTRSSDMLANGYFAHSSPSGQTWYSLLSSLGLSYSAGGENLAKVTGDAVTSVSTAIEALMASPTHRANILNPAYRVVGVGAAVQGDSLTILTSIFTDR